MDEETQTRIAEMEQTVAEALALAQESRIHARVAKTDAGVARFIAMAGYEDGKNLDGLETEMRNGFSQLAELIKKVRRER